MQSNKFTLQSLFSHLIFWVIYGISNAYLWHTFDRTYNETTLYGITRLPIKMIATYINFYLMVEFFFKKKYFIFFSLFLLNMFLAGFIQTYISAGGVFSYESFTQYSLPIYSVVLLSSVLIIIRQFFIQVRKSKQMEIEKIKSELGFLKAQFQPHFLFNTLNNIYSLTINNSQLAGKSILQLSGLLRYMLYESETEKVDLQKEIDYLRDYIELERIRFASRLEISFNISGTIADKKIVPILLITFLENAFKHASNKLNEKIWITIDLIVKEKNLCFTVENSVYPEGKTQMHNNHSGIGLENVKRRLSLLYENYTLNNELKENYYHADLKIPLG
jgi:two-component system, LytTR family, sensor kinase